jgi:PDZ domain-containing protein
MAYVSVVQGSLPWVLMGLIIPDWDVVPESDSTYENETIEDANIRSKLYLEQSKDFATSVAMDVAGIEYSISNKINYVAYVDVKANTTLKVGDNILSINGEEIDDISILSSRIQDIKAGDKVNFIVERNGKEKKASAIVYEEDGKHYVGISAITTFDIASDVNVEISSKSSESGPSGGMMMTLMVYNALTNQDLTYGKKIVGTGTISLDGTVGEIGGVKYKLMGAVKEDADIFLVPKDNYKEAMDVKKKKEYNIEIVSVETFEDVVDYLEGL